MKIKNILLTGGSGFIGRNILESGLSRSYNILSPVHGELDLLDENSVEAYFKNNPIDAVIHCAGKPGHRNAKDLANLFGSNVRMFYNLARMQDSYKKMLVMGSGAIYDNRYYRPKLMEEDAFLHIPQDEHGFCRYVCGKYIEKSENIIDLRIFGIFGKYEDYAIRFISNMICKTIFDLPLTMKQNRVFDYLYIDDLMPVLDFFLQNDIKYKAYNITPGKSAELHAIAESVLAAAGKNLPIIMAQSGMGPEYSGDNSRLKAEMKEISFTPLETSIDKLYSWYLLEKDRINRDLLLTDK